MTANPRADDILRKIREGQKKLKQEKENEKSSNDNITENIIKNSKHIGNFKADNGRIELGDCGKVQMTVGTVDGDGIYPVFCNDGYIIIDVDMLRVMQRQAKGEAA